MARAKNSTWRGVNCPVGKGRCAVRAITVYKYLHKDEIGGRVTVISGGVVTVQDLDRSVQETIDRCRRSYFMAV